MVGEIRDQETAKLAVEASLTGHLVLATLHTNTAAAAVARLTEMGVEPYLLASTLRSVVAQRLPRRICKHCIEAYEAPAEVMVIYRKSLVLYQGLIFSLMLKDCCKTESNKADEFKLSHVLQQTMLGRKKYFCIEVRVVQVL
jgi:type II secretory ATPase GspE/PulE/Tfp pilus assembly ATPase PilB-like protein